MDMEAQGHSEHPEALRLWLRLLTCTQLVEKQVRNHLREQFDTTLPRFDLMAQLQRNPDGLKMNELSRRMMVTGGNVTGITDRVRLTVQGRETFDAMAKQHEGWIVSSFDVLTGREMDALYKLLGKVKEHHHAKTLEIL